MSDFHIEVACNQRNYNAEHICGDVFLSERLKEEGRVVSVLSDGMGHGVKANVLATLTASMAINFAQEHKDAQTIGNIIIQTLPVCSERKTSYSTFTIVDAEDNKVEILEYDNPRCLVMRGGNVLEVEWDALSLEIPDKEGRCQDIMTCSFRPMKEDRIIFISDGVTQSGMGADNFLLGWGRDAFVEYVKETIYNERDISASKLAQRVVNKAHSNDNYKSKDDTSCRVIYFRNPRKMIIATGPPFYPENDKGYVDILRNFNGYKVICGATTADIFSRELNIVIEDDFNITDSSLPPMSKMDGMDLVTEGILTLNKVVTILTNETASSMKLGNGPADQIIKLLMDSDEIVIMVGTKINQAHHEPNIPIEIEIRRTTVKRIADLLEKKFMKEVQIEYV